MDYLSMTTRLRAPASSKLVIAPLMSLHAATSPKTSGSLCRNHRRADRACDRCHRQAVNRTLSGLFGVLDISERVLSCALDHPRPVQRGGGSTFIAADKVLALSNWDLSAAHETQLRLSRRRGETPRHISTDISTFCTRPPRLANMGAGSI